MPAAAVAAAGAVAAGAIASGGVNRATAAQERTAREALQYQRDRERTRTERYDQAQEEYRRQYEAWFNRFYGSNANGGGNANGGPLVGLKKTDMPNAPFDQTSAPVGAGPGGVTPPLVPGQTPTQAAPSLTGAPVVPPVVPPPTTRTLADLAGWSEHRRYLGAGA